MKNPSLGVPRWLVPLLVLALIAVHATAASAGFELLAKASDSQVGDSSKECVKPTFDPSSGDLVSVDHQPHNVPCPAGYFEKTNETYIQAMHKWDGPSGEKKLFLGASGNVGCTTIGTTASLNDVFDGLADPYLFSADVGGGQLVGGTCEYELSPRAQSQGGPLPDAVADAWIPGLYVYDKVGDSLTKLAGSGVAPLPTAAQGRLENSILVRAAVAFNNLAIFFTVPASGTGIHAFAFRATDHAFLGSTTLGGLTNMRKCIVVPGGSGQDIPYCAVQTVFGQGSVLRMTGSPANPFAYVTVGNLGAPGANIAFGGGRVWVATWPGGFAGFFNPNARAGVWMGPPHPAGGYSPLQANQWQQIFQMGQYEWDFVIRTTNAMGDLTWCDDSLLITTQQVPGGGAVLHDLFFGPTGIYDAGGPYEGELFDLTERPTMNAFVRNPTSFFRSFDVMYGPQSGIPTFFDLGFNQWFDLTPQIGSGQHGEWGFGNDNNLYSWIAFELDGKCYVGTFDQNVSSGADLWRYDGDDGPATPVTTSGGPTSGLDFLSFLQYGFRTRQVWDDAAYLGTAGIANLTQTVSPVVKASPGWRLLKYTPDP